MDKTENLEDKYQDLQREIKTVEERQLEGQKIHRKLSDIFEEMNYTFQRALQDSSRILDESYQSKYAIHLNSEYNALGQNRNHVLQGIGESIQVSERILKQDQNKVDDLYRKKGKVFQEMKERGEL